MLSRIPVVPYIPSHTDPKIQFAIPVYHLCYDHFMARITDHPLRLARIRAGFSQQQLASKAGVNRAAISAAEDGRTAMPNDKILAVFGDSDLRKEIELWNARPLSPSLRPSARNLFLIPPYTLNQYYASFAQWRAEIAPTPTAFASMLRINPAIVRDYESGKLQQMPDGLSAKMLEAFGFDGEYLVALEGLARG
jgi:transcriptional regulator with XRE-family HTH domain